MKDVMERIVELVKEDKELHDAIVALLKELTIGKQLDNERRKKKLGK